MSRSRIEWPISPSSVREMASITRARCKASSCSHLVLVGLSSMALCCTQWRMICAVTRRCSGGCGLTHLHLPRKACKGLQAILLRTYKPHCTTYQSFVVSTGSNVTFQFERMNVCRNHQKSKILRLFTLLCLLVPCSAGDRNIHAMRTSVFSLLRPIPVPRTCFWRVDLSMPG